MELEKLLEKYKKVSLLKGIKYEYYTTNINNKKRLSLIFMMTTDDIQLYFEEDNNRIKIFSKNKTISEQQLINLITQRLKKKYINNIECSNTYLQQYIIIDFDILKSAFVYCLKFVLHLKDYCILSGNKLDYPSSSYIISSDIDCIDTLDELPIGDFIVNHMRDYPTVIEFLLKSGFASLQSTRKNDIFEPFPPRFLLRGNVVKRGELSALTGVSQTKDFGIIYALIKDTNVKNILQNISDSTTDNELRMKLGDDLFYLVRFIIMTNKTDLRHVKLFNDTLDKTILQFKIIHKPDVEKAFNDVCGNEKSCYLFHGSGFENWYSILRNGIKIMSNTALMVNASAYGNGIYLSDNFSFSYNYSIKSPWNGNIIIAVFEIKGKKEDYKRSNNIYVVNNSNWLLLRYLFIIKTKEIKLDNTTISKINSLFNVELIEEKEKKEVQYNSRSITRVHKELKDVLKANQGFTIELSNSDDLMCWKVLLTDLAKSDLTNDMVKYNIPNIELEIRFSNEYPMKPPFVRIVRPIFIYRSGRVTSGGSICTDFLTTQSWSPAMRMENLIITIKTLLTEGDGRIDPERLGCSYDLKSAYISFTNVAKSHGWL